MRGVLVSGATTPLGVAVLEHLAARGMGPLLAIGREAPEEAEAMLPRGVQYHAVDLTRSRHVRRLLYGPVARAGVQGIVHLAAHRDPRATGAQVHRLNVDATRLMLRLTEEHPTVRAFVYRSTARVYQARTDQPDVLREDAPLDLDPASPQWVRDRVEADVTVCARMGLTRARVVVLRCAEVLAAGVGSQLHDYLSSRVCLRPMGYDPMVELLSLEDAARAVGLALERDAEGVFHIAGKDRLPLSRLIRRWGRDDVPVPSPLLGPLYALRAAARGGTFDWALNRHRFHVNAVLDGTRAARELGYRPQHGVSWPTEHGAV